MCKVKRLLTSSSSSITGRALYGGEKEKEKKQKTEKEAMDTPRTSGVSQTL